MCHTFKQFKVAASQFAGGAGVEMKSVAAVNQTCGRGDTDKLQLFRKLMHDSVDAGNVFLDILFVEITKFAEEEGDSVQIQITAEVRDDRAQILFFALSLFLVYKKEIAQYRWFLIFAIIMIPLAYIASESGWIVAEIGRQPWTIQDLLPVSAAISDIEAGSVATTFFIFLALFTTMLAVEISILVKQIKKGPEYD